jgi:hypothetical protein
MTVFHSRLVDRFESIVKPNRTSRGEEEEDDGSPIQKANDRPFWRQMHFSLKSHLGSKHTNNSIIDDWQRVHP